MRGAAAPRTFQLAVRLRMRCTTTIVIPDKARGTVDPESIFDRRDGAFAVLDAWAELVARDAQAPELLVLGVGA